MSAGQPAAWPSRFVTPVRRGKGGSGQRARGSRSCRGNLVDICKTTVFLLNATLFEPMNHVYREYFTPPCPARSAVVAPLSNPDLCIEIEAIAYLPVGT